MKKSRITFAGIVVFLALVCVTFVFVRRSKGPQNRDGGQSAARSADETGGKNGVHQAEIPDEKVFHSALKKTYPAADSRKIIGGIVPHHNLASFMLADFLSRLKNQEIETLVVITPNHAEAGNKKIITGRYSWQTAFGTIETEKEIIRNLTADGFAEINEEVVGSEHAVAEFMPFAKYYLPQAKVVPLILKKGTGSEEIRQLAGELSDLSEKNSQVAIIASVDFSHYLNGNQADEKDEETVRALERADYQKISSFGNDHLDSPASILALMMALGKNKPLEYEIMNHTNSGRLLNDIFSKTTSYFEIIFF